MLQYTILDLVKRPFVVYKDTYDNKVCLEPRRGMTNKKVMIISLPRSGTHMLAKVLETCNLFHVRVMQDTSVINDYRFLSDDDRIKFARHYDSYSLPIEETYKWILSGQFVCNRMRYDDKMYCMIRDSEYLVYLLRRDLRSSLVSHARQKQRENLYIVSEGQNVMEKYIELPYYKEISSMYELMAPWYEKKLFDIIDYEDIIGQRGKDKQNQILTKIMEDLDIDGITIDHIIQKCIGVPTFSYSGKTCEYTAYWNYKIDTWFQQTGMNKINEKIYRT